MDALEAVERLARKAREERVPETDVSQRVLMRLGRPVSPRVAPLGWVAAVAAVAAAAVLIVALNSWISPSDPMMDLFTPLQVASR